MPALSTLADDWLKRRERTHRAWRDDCNRWRKHLAPALGRLRPSEVDQAADSCRLVETKLAEGLSSTSCKHLVRLLSTFFSDLCEQGHAGANPARGLPRQTRRLIRDAHDPKQTPFIEKQQDIARIYEKLAQPFATIFIAGALMGCRPGELIAIEWSDVDLGGRRILVQRQVRHGKVGPTKSGKPRLVPIIGNRWRRSSPSGGWRRRGGAALQAAHALAPAQPVHQGQHRPRGAAERFQGVRVARNDDLVQRQPAHVGVTVRDERREPRRSRSTCWVTAASR